MADIVVIGAGFSGLTASALLARDGHRVHLLEQGSEAGGRSGLWREGGFAFDTGPSWMLMREVYEHTFKLLGRDLDEVVEITRLDPAYRVHVEGAPETFEVSGDYATTRARFEEREPGAGAALDAYLASARKLVDVSERFFLWNRFDRIHASLIRGVAGDIRQLARMLSGDLESFVAKQFRDDVLRRVLTYPAVFLGSRPDAIPALYHLMSAFDLDQGVYYPQGGFGAIVSALEAAARESGAVIHFRTRARRIDVEAGFMGLRPKVAGVRADGPDGAVQLRADRVVVACDQAVALPALLPERARRVRARWRTKEPGPGAVLVMLGVAGRLPVAHHTLVFTRDWKANFDAVFDDRSIPDPASFYVCAPSTTDPSVAPEGCENLFILIPVGADPGLGGGGVAGSGDAAVEAAADAAIEALATILNTPDLAERVIVRRTVGPHDFEAQFGTWRGSALGPAHTLTQSAMFRGRVKSRAARGLFAIGSSSVPGIGVPMCLISAEQVLKHMRGDTKPGPAEEPPGSGPAAQGATRRRRG